MRLLLHALVAVLVGQAAIGAFAALRRAWHAADIALVERCTTSTDARIARAFGEEAAVVELLATSVPPGAVVFVDWPPTFQADPNATDVGAEAEPILHWVATIERARFLLYPSPTILRMVPGAFAAAEAMAGAGAEVRLAAPGEAMLARIRPTLPAAAAGLPAACGIPAGRPGWSLAASNPRCQLWRFRKE